MVLALAAGLALMPAAALAHNTGPHAGQSATCFPGYNKPVTIWAHPGEQATVGTAGDDVIQGTPGNDVIFAGPGNEIVCALAGNDKVYGGAGNDQLWGIEGADKLDGGEGTDVCGRWWGKHDKASVSCEFLGGGDKGNG